MKKNKLASLPITLLTVLSATVAGCSGGGGGGGGGSPAPISATSSTVVASAPFGASADGVEAITILVTVLDTDGEPVSGERVELASDDLGASLVQPAGRTDTAGMVSASLTATIPGAKTVRATVDPGPDAVELVQRATSEFVRLPNDARYVRTSGDDSNTGTSPLQAWRTIGFALSQLASGETLYVGAGRYEEVLEVLTGGASTDPTTIRGDRDGRFTGDVGEVVVDALGASWSLRVAADHVVVRGLSFVGAAPAGGKGAGLFVEGASDVWLVQNTAYGNDRGISVADAARVLLESNRISNNLGASGDGLHLVRSSDVTVEHNLIYNNARYGLWVEDAVAGVTLRLNTLYQNANDQVREDGAGSFGSIRNCVVTEGGAAGFALVGGTGISETKNLVWGQVGPNKTLGGTESAPSASADPLFADPAGSDGLLGGLEGRDDDFRLDGASPAFDAADEDASQTTLFFGGALTGFSSRSDGIGDGTSPDGAAANLGFHEPIRGTDQDALRSGGTRLAYARAGEVRPASRGRASTGAWSGEAVGTPANLDVRWVVTKASPLANAEEVVALLTDDGTTTNLFTRVFDGARWREENPFRRTDSAIASADADVRGFDVEYEAASGEALLAYSNGTSNPVFRVFADGEWSAEAPVLGADPGWGKVLWVELARRPGTDEIALVCLHEDESLSAVLWDGESWESSATRLDTMIATLREGKPFDVAYESLSGDLLVLWGHTTVIEETRFAVRAADTTNWVLGAEDSTDAHGVTIRLAADPASDRILAGVVEGPYGDDTVGMTWSGDAWTSISELDLTSAANQRDVAVGWVGDESVGVVVYADDDGAGTLDWFVWNEGWRRRNDVALPIGDFAFGRTLPLESEDRMLLLLADDSGELFSLATDGDTWSLEGGGPLASGLRVDGLGAAFDGDRRD